MKKSLVIALCTVLGIASTSIAQTQVFTGELLGKQSISIVSRNQGTAKNLFELGAQLYGAVSCGGYNCPDYVVNKIDGTTIQQLGKTVLNSSVTTYGASFQLDPALSQYKLNAARTELVLNGKAAEDLILSGLVSAQGVSCTQGRIAVCKIAIR